MTDPSDLLNLIGTGGSIFDDIGINSMPSSSLPQNSTTDQFFNMDSFQNFPNQQQATPQQKLHHLGGQSPSQEQFQPFSQKLSHFANPMLNQQGGTFQNSVASKPQPPQQSQQQQQQQQQFARMPGMRMQSPSQFSPQPSSSPGTNWRGQSNMVNSFGSFGLPQQSQQPSTEQSGNPIPPGYMSPQQTNMQRLQHFMTNKQSNPMLSQTPNQFMGQVAENSSTLTDISNSTPNNRSNQTSKTLSPGQQFNPDMARQEHLSKLHHLVSGGMPSPTSDTPTNSNSPMAGFTPASSSSFTPSPDPFSPNKSMQPMYNNMPQQQPSPIPNQAPMQPQDPFTPTPPPSSVPQDYLMRQQQQFPDGGYQMRPNVPFQQQMMNQNQNPMSSQLKSAHLLYQLQRLQQQISQVRELPSPARDQPLQQLQQQFSRLYHMYLMDQQRQKKQQQAAAQMRFDQENLLKQQHQDKANRIVAEAIAKSALMNSSFNYQAEPQMKYFNQQFRPAVKGPMNYDMQQDKIAQQKAAEPIVLPPSIVNQLPKTVRSSSKPPATVLNKPVVRRERRDSSDHEPSPPTSPGSFYPEDNTPSSITRRSLRERKKKTYKDDFDYNLSDEEDGNKAASAGAEVVKHESGELEPGALPVTEEIPVQEENLTVEKILALRTETKEDGFAQEEFLVKYKNYSYLHAEWATAEKLMQLDKRVQMKIKRFFVKRNSMPFPDEIDDEPFNPDYVEVDRVLDVSTGVDQATGAPVSHYLVKWRSLPYDESTWEVEADVDDESVNRFRSIQVAPQPHERQFRRRPHPSEWRKLDKSPMFKNSNTLREYQLEGLNWLTFCWYNGQNCILADEMGLGKTIQSLTFLLHVKQYGIRGPFLVIAPLSTIANWQREFEGWGDMNVVVHHGSAASRHLIQQYEFYFRGSQGEPVIGVYKFNVLITTYEILIADNMLLSSVPWRVVVIDEAHRLKNRNCKLLEGLNNLQMEHRILLTGTPLQNNVDELFSLLNFLEPAQFPSQGAFLMEFGNLRTEAQVERLQALLRPMMLRRMKEDVEKSLAPKEETIVEVELTTVQKKFYRAILERNFSFLNKGAVSTSNVPNLMNTMMELRKCCNHPFLINGAEEKIVGEYHANSSGENREAIHLTSLIEASGKLVLIDKLLPKLKAGGHKVLIFSQMVRCLDILEDYLICKKYLFERIDGRVRGNLRQAAIDRFSKPDSDRFVFLLCTRAGGLGINLTAADTVIIFDSDWNPQNDLQAQARCHRIGQAKSVKVYRLITRNSYEREMFDRASLKLGLDKAVLQSMNSKDGSANAGGQNQTMSKKEIEDLLKKGAYGAVMDDDDASSKFCEEDIDQILERRTQVITIDSVGQGSTFAKASFTATKKGEDIDIDDPDFWKKWAMKADIDVDELMNKDERIIDAPRQRKQTKRYGRGDDVDFELSDLDSDEEVPQAKRRAWTRVECFKVEKNLLVYGWQRWKDIIHAIRKRKLSEREVEAISRSILLFCVHAYRGDEKLRSFILELIKPLVTRERLPSEELDATYMPVQKGSGKKSKKGSKKGKSGNKNVNKSAIAVIEALGDWKSINPELLILDEGYKKHLRHHCNKILLRVRLLYIMRVEVIGAMEAAVRNNCLASEIDVNLPLTDGDPPIAWWNEDADKSLVIGVYKHGYERYNAIRADPSLIFLKKCGPPTSSDEAATGDAIDGEGLREEDDNRDDPDYQLPQDRKTEDAESDDDVDFDMEGKETPRPVVKEEVKVVEKPPAVDGNQSHPVASSNFLPWPSPSDLNTRLRRIVAGFQRILKKEELKRVAVEKENRRKEKVEEAVRQKELKKAEQAQKWSKREEVDFYRCVSTYGVHISPATGEYDWSKFRQMARLDKKNDDRLSQYFMEFLAMCKRVCGRATDEEIILGQNVEAISEERASRCLRRVELTTMLRLEVLNHPQLDERLKLAQITPELPSWWRCEKHDKDLLIGVAKHGLTRTDLNILEDPELSFYELKSEMDAQHIALAGNSTDLTGGSPESSSRGVSGTPVALDRRLDKTVLEKIERLENQDGSLDTQTFPVVPKATSVILPNPQTTANAATTDNTARTSEPPPPATYDSQNYVNDMPSVPGSDALSSLVKQVSSLPSNPPNPEGDLNPGSERRPEIPPPSYMDTDSQGSLPPDINNLNPVVNESLSIKIWWPKDRVVFHRVQQLCQLVVSGEWPAKPEKPERLVDQPVLASEMSMSPSGFPLYAESEMDAALGPEAIVDPAVSKAFKIKKHEGLKVTLKKNRKRKKKDEEAGIMMDGVGDMNLPPDAMMHQPAYPNDTNIRLKMDPSEIAGPLPLPKPRRKRQRKVDKPPKPPAERKKRGRKSKMEKLMAQAAADARHAGLSQQPGGEWARAKGSGMFMPGEMMNGPQHHESVLVKDVNMRRASLENQMSELPRVPPQTSVETAPPSMTMRTSVLKSTTSGDGDIDMHPRRLSSTSSHPDNDPPPPLKSPNIPGNPVVMSPTSKTPVRLSPFNSTEFPFGNHPFVNYPNYPSAIGFPRPPSSTSPGFAAGFAGQPKTSTGSSPTSTSSSGSVDSGVQKAVYESSFHTKTPSATKLSESLGFNGFPSGIPTSTVANYAKLDLEADSELKVFNSDSENEPSDSLEASEEEAAPLSPAPS